VILLLRQGTISLAIGVQSAARTDRKTRARSKRECP
jgi:hypothetical protein